MQKLIFAQHEVTHFKNHPGSHILIPSVGTYTSFAEVEANNFSSAVYDFFKKKIELFYFKTAWDGGSGMRTKFGV
jgi:hypothetical protein